MDSLSELVRHQILTYLPIVPMWHRQKLHDCLLELKFYLYLLDNLWVDVYMEF